MMAGAGAGWRVAVARPGHDPLGNLARALAEEGVLASAGAGLQPEEREAFVEAMLRGGFTRADAAKIVGGNYLRIFAASVG
jgi:microsomal dipeptidase-like Zn-dependent dipeptidase